MASPTATRQDVSSNYDFHANNSGPYGGPNSYLGMGGVGDMMLESQEIDMSALGGDMMPWLEYLPQDVLNFFDNGNTVSMSTASGDINNNLDMGNMGRSNG
jgi:hypothetical protein